MYTRPWMGQENQLLQGPLLKSFLTIELEKLIALIVVNPRRVKITYSEADLYSLKINKKAYNLSFILTYANLNQLEISDVALEELNRLLNKNILENVPVPHGDAVLHLLKPIERQVLHYYTDDYYLDIGRLFRGESVVSFDNIIYNFLVGCILCHTANQLPGLIGNKIIYPEEKKILLKVQQAAVDEFKNKKKPRLIFLDEITSKAKYKSTLRLAKQRKNISIQEFNRIEQRYNELRPLLSGYGQLFRKEKLEKEHSLKRRYSSAIPLPSVTSCAYKKDVWDGSHITYFPSYRLPRLKSISAHNDEREVMLPAGAMVAYKRDSQNSKNFIATVVSGLQFSERYWPLNAIYYAIELHLSQKYEDESDSRMIGNYMVHRPNHGGPHTYDVMRSLPKVIKYFFLHARDKKFAKLCKEMDFYLFDWLQMAMVFSVTGRESEIAFSDDQDLYFSYRLKSQSQFRAYNRKNIALNHDPNRILNLNRMDELILYMGNPKYPDIIKGKYSKKEIQTRLYLHTLITLAHKLDLPRCYSYKEYMNSLSGFASMVVASPRQFKDWVELQQFAITSIKSRGDCLQFMVDSKGGEIDYYQFYQPEFGEFSENILKFIKLREICAENLGPVALAQTVSSPVLSAALSTYPDTVSYDKLLADLPAMNYQQRLAAILQKDVNGNNLLRHAAGDLPKFKKIYTYIKNEQWLDYLLVSSKYQCSPMQLALHKPEVLKFIFDKINNESLCVTLIKHAFEKGQFLLADSLNIPKSFAMIISAYHTAALLNHLTLASVNTTGKSVLSMLAYQPASLTILFEHIGRLTAFNLCRFKEGLMSESLVSAGIALPETLKVIISSMPEYKLPLIWQDVDNSGYTLFFRSFYNLTKRSTFSNPAGLGLILDCIPVTSLNDALTSKELNGVSNTTIISYEPLNLAVLIKKCPRSTLLTIFGFNTAQTFSEKMFGFFSVSQSNNTMLHELVREFMHYENKDYFQLHSLSESIMIIFDYLEEDQRIKYIFDEFEPQKKTFINIVNSHFNPEQKKRFHKLLPDDLKNLISMSVNCEMEYFGKEANGFMDMVEDESDVVPPVKKARL